MYISGTPWHVSFGDKKKDDGRSKTKCIYFNKGCCMAGKDKCDGTLYCRLFKPKNDIENYVDDKISPISITIKKNVGIDYRYLIGYKFGVVWLEDNDFVEYTILDSNADISKNEVNIDTTFVKSIEGKTQGEIGESNGHKFYIKYIICPEFKDICQRRNIKTLYHFTDLNNLKSILKYGILSIDEMKKNNIKYICNDKNRFDNHTEYISCSIEHPNGPLLYKLKNSDPSKIFVLLEIDVDVLNYKYVLCSKYNAAKENGKYITGLKFFNELYKGDRNNILDNYPTNEQAEILIKDCIETKQIKKIIFENQEDVKMFACNSFNWEVNPQKFKYRSSYLAYLKYKPKSI